MRRVDARRFWIAGAALVAVAMAAFASAQGADAKSAPQSLKGVIDAVLQKGPDSQLPAHLSGVLGINKFGQATAVKQAVMRDGTMVRTFNVGAVNHDAVVMMAYNEQSRSMKAYLVSPAGKLLKAVAYQAGALPVQRAAAEARGDFAGEIKFWTETAHVSGPAK